MDYKFLRQINSPDDVKKLNNGELKVLCEEIRDCLIKTVSKTGGHLASNLGVVELTVALHSVFSTPKDSIIFDVGHQCYTHKLLTGRLDRFDSLRQEGGLSGFMRPSESEHDSFITGHSSNSISAAYGIFEAKSREDRTHASIAVVGDGAMTGGMIYEALNNAGDAEGPFIVVLNDNKMSISKNVGAMARYFSVIRTKPRYYRFKHNFQKFLKSIPLGKYIYAAMFRSKRALKNAIYKCNIFESMGFSYLGPVDGHDIAKLKNIFTIAKEQNRPAIVHVMTKKGKGYSFAEDSPNAYHGVSSFDIEKGVESSTKETFSSVCGKTLCELAKRDDKICAITAAMCEGTGLSAFAEKFPDRFFDVGIAEEHAMTFSGGLAAGGMKPFFVVYSSFLQRSYDQIIHDAAIANVPVKICVDRAGVVGEDGETHQGLFDVAFLSTVPNMQIYSPANLKELELTLKKVAENSELCAVRYPRGTVDNKTPFTYDDKEFTVIGDKSDVAVLTYGREFNEVYAAYEELKVKGVSVTVIKLNKIYPLSDELVNTVLGFKKVYFYEESIKSGSVSEHLAARLLENLFSGSFKAVNISNTFVPACDVAGIIRKFELDAQSIVKTLGEN